MNEKPSIPFTNSMFLKIDWYRKANMFERDTFFKLAWISWKPTIDYRKKTGRISYKMVRRLQKIWIDLSS